MKRIIYFLCVAFLCLFLGVYGFYLIKSPASFPYFGGQEFRFVNLYSEYKVEYPDTGYDSYLDADAALASLLKVDSAYVRSFNSLVSTLKNTVVVSRIRWQNLETIIVAGKLDEKGERCYSLPFKVVGKEYYLFTEPVPILLFSSDLVSRCNEQSEFLKPELVGFFDFVYMQMMNCLGNCKLYNGVKYISKGSASFNSDISKGIFDYLVKTSNQSGINLELNENKLTVLSVVRLKDIVFISFEYVDDTYGRIEMDLKFDADSEGEGKELNLRDYRFLQYVGVKQRG